MNYSEYVEKTKLAIQKYEHLPLYEFIVNVFKECGEDLSLIDNMHIDENVEEYPGIGVCYRHNGVYTICVFDDLCKKDVRNYTDPYRFIHSFINAAYICHRRKNKT